MAASSPRTDLNPDFKLSARQKQLLFAALNSNNPSSVPAAMPVSTDGLTMPPSAFINPSVQAPGLGVLSAYEGSSFVDYDNELDADSGFDYAFGNDSQGDMTGKMLKTSSDGGVDNEPHDKRSHDDVDDEQEGGGKRREGEDKVPKKPGRKALTSEPITKRKAQNRAAQRAFRERKEKHLKDLEAKVDDLQKASESANHENSVLRAQIEKMSIELRDYRKSLSITGGQPQSSTERASYFPGKGVSNLIDLNFQFEFPKFGKISSPSVAAKSTNGSRASTSSSTTTQQKSSPSGSISPNNQQITDSQFPNSIIQSPGATDGDMSDLSRIFSPPMSESNDVSVFLHDTQTMRTGSSNSQLNGHGTTHSSPSTSSNSNVGPTSSCGTSPEPSSLQSPAYSKTSDSNLTTIKEESVTNNVPFENAIFDMNGIDWLAQQNGNQFDPQLFGDYREPLENILSNDPFDPNYFFSDAFPMPDFSIPLPSESIQTPPKKDLIQQIDEQQNKDDESKNAGEMMACNTIWDRLQSCPKVAAGELDIDNLCKDLHKKAKCSESGPLLREKDFHEVMYKHLNERRVKKEAANSQANGLDLANIKASYCAVTLGSGVQ